MAYEISRFIEPSGLLILEGLIYSQADHNANMLTIVGWSMKSSPKADLVIDALLMAIWRRKPK